MVRAEMYDASGKLLNGIKIIYINILAYIRIKGGERECCEIRLYHFSLALYMVYMDAAMKEVKMNAGG